VNAVAERHVRVLGAVEPQLSRVREALLVPVGGQQADDDEYADVPTEVAEALREVLVFPSAATPPDRGGTRR
jgi:hypothetical protein